MSETSVKERMTRATAASLWRAYQWALNGDPNMPFGMLPPANRAGWEAVAARGDAAIEAMEGATFADAGQALFALHSPKDAAAVFADFLPYYRLCWEAVARHLYALLEEDEIEDLAALEQSWRGWAEKRLQQQRTA